MPGNNSRKGLALAIHTDLIQAECAYWYNGIFCVETSTQLKYFDRWETCTSCKNRTQEIIS